MRTTFIRPRRYLTALALLLLATVGGAQPVRKTATYAITLNGTSNLHDWSMKASGGGLEANFTVVPGKMATLNPPMLFTLPVKNLKSGESLMDSRAYNTLKADQYPVITFRLTGISIATPQGDRALVRASGQLSIAGTTRDIVLNAASVSSPDGSVQFTGTQLIHFSEYGLKAPSFMLGALRCGDDLVISYNVRFN